MYNTNRSIVERMFGRTPQVGGGGQVVQAPQGPGVSPQGPMGAFANHQTMRAGFPGYNPNGLQPPPVPQQQAPDLSWREKYEKMLANNPGNSAGPAVRAMAAFTPDIPDITRMGLLMFPRQSAKMTRAKRRSGR